MANVVPITQHAKEIIEHTNKLPALKQQEQWSSASDKQRSVALNRERFIQPILDNINIGASANVAVRNLLAKLEAGDLSDSFCKLGTKLGKKGKYPGRSTILEWVKKYRENGKSGLIDHHTGRRRKDYGWEAEAVKLYNNPNKPSFKWVARRLREFHGYENATDTRVQRYLKTLPATLGNNSPERLGRHLYNNTQRHYIHRTTENLRVGDLYQADGHCIDVYLEHPRTGNIWRAELTVFMDVRSRYIVGWAISGSESSIATIQAIGRSLINHNHVPPMLYVDNGCGYVSKIMSEETTGFYDRLNIETIFAIPGNAKAKGNIERFFRTMERDFNIGFGNAFVGEGHSPEVARIFVKEQKAGLQKAPTLAQWSEEFTKWLDLYHNRPHPEDKSTTPAELWASLEAIPVHIDPEELFNARTTRTVQRSAITLDKRKYFASQLLDYNGKKVVCEYNFEQDETIAVRDEKGRLICDAQLVEKKDYIPQSRIEQARIKSSRAAVQRLERKAHEIQMRAGNLVENNNHQSDELHTLQQQYDVLEHEGSTEDEINIDLHDFD